MSNARNTLLGAAKVRRETLTLDVEDTPVRVEVRGLTAGARGRLLNTARTEDGTLDFERYYAQLVVETAHDAETGEPMFSAADLDAVNALPSGIVQVLGETAESLSGLGGDAAKALEGNSARTPSAATTSASPSDSAAQ